MSKLNNFCFLSLFLKPSFALQKQFQRGLIEAVIIIMGELKNLTTNIRLWLKYQSYITFVFGSLFLKPMIAPQKQFQLGLMMIIIGKLKNLTTNIRLWLKYQSYIIFVFCIFFSNQWLPRRNNLKMIIIGKLKNVNTNIRLGLKCQS
jgi:hypothetical protein